MMKNNPNLIKKKKKTLMWGYMGTHFPLNFSPNLKLLQKKVY